eukprot:gene31400-37955_t
MMGEQIGVVTGYTTVTNEDNESSDEHSEKSEEMPSKDQVGPTLALEGVTYAEIQYFSQSLATHLYYRFGIRAHDRVVIVTNNDTSAEIVAMLACMRIEAVFIPLDLSQLSKERLTQILADSSPLAAIVQGADDSDPNVLLLASLGLYRCALVRTGGSLVEDEATVTSDLIDSLPAPTAPISMTSMLPHPLYILFTSGSTGASKGVIGTLEGLVQRVRWQLQTYPYSYPEAVCRRTPLTFVDSLTELWCPLIAGVPIYAQFMGRISSEGLASVVGELEDLGVTRLTIIPSLFYQAARLNPEGMKNWASLRYFTVSGEECSMEVAKMFAELYFPTDTPEETPPPTLLNLYGSTEVTGDITHFALTPSSLSVCMDLNKVPIGACMPQNYVFLVEYTPDSGINAFLTSYTEDGEVIYIEEDGENKTGEVMVIGAHVALGYAPASCNAHRFIPNPYHSHASAQASSANSTLPSLPLHIQSALSHYPLAYLMGDICSYHKPSKSLLYVGRVAAGIRQVKIHGVRVELDAVERVLKNTLQSDGLMLLHIPAPGEDRQSSATSTSLMVLLINTSLLPCDNHQALRSQLLSRVEDSHALLVLRDCIVLTRTDWLYTSSFKVDRRKMEEELKTVVWGSGDGNGSEGDRNSGNYKHEIEALNALLQSSGGGYGNGNGNGNGNGEGENAVLSAVISIFQRVLAPKSPAGQLASVANNGKLDLSTDFYSLGGDSLAAIELLYLLRGLGGKVAIGLQDLAKPIAHIAQMLKQDGREAIAAEEEETEGRISKKARLVPPSFVSFVEESPPPATVSAALPVLTGCLGRGGERQGMIPSPPPITTRPHLASIPSSSSNYGNNSVIRWSYALGRCVDASPLLCFSEQKCYVLGASHGGEVLCLEEREVAQVDKAEGAVIAELAWRVLLPHHIESSLSCHVASNRVFVSSYRAHDKHDHHNIQSGDAGDNMNMGRVTALDFSSGSVVWARDFAGEVKGSVAVRNPCFEDEQGLGAVVYGASYQGEVWALCVETGLVKARTKVEGAVFASPRLSPDNQEVCIATTRGHVYVFTPQLIPLLATTYSLDTSIFTTPLYCGCAIVVGGTDGCVRGLLRKDTEKMEMTAAWEVWGAAPVFSSPVRCGDGVVFGCHDGKVRWIKDIAGQADAVVTEEVTLGSALFGTPFLLDHSGSSHENSSRLVIASTSGGVHVVEKEGAVRSARLAGEIFASPVVWGDRIYVGCRDDKVYCLNLLAL